MILELRQYTLHPGRRDDLISLFEREFVDSQLALGMTLPGLFRDAGDPDRFVWLRGFADMPARKAALEAFYGGPVWKAHRDAANATMIDSDNVLLLKVVRDFAPDVRAGSPVTATIHYFDAPSTTTSRTRPPPNRFWRCFAVSTARTPSRHYRSAWVNTCW